MSVTVMGNNVVEFNHGGKKAQLQCKDEAEAKKAVAELTKAEAQMVEQEKKLGLTSEQFMNALEKAAVKPQGVGEKLDVQTA